jgi:hypothetical protein
MARPTDDEQRCKIWDALYHSGGSLPIADIALSRRPTNGCGRAIPSPTPRPRRMGVPGG